MIKLFVTGLFVLLTFCASEEKNMQPVIKVLRTKTEEKNLIQNGDFENIEEDKIHAWKSWRQGYKVAKKAGRDETKAAYCKSETGNEEHGISQSVELNQSIPVPLSVSGWSKAKNVSGGRDSGYSIYVDIIFQDGTPLWGQTGKFNTGIHDWEMQKFIIVPSKPIKRITVYGLFRGHTGEVWFDDFQVSEVGGSDSAMLDSVPIESPSSHTVKMKESAMQIPEISTSSGLSIRYNRNKNEIVSLKLDNSELAQDVPSGFLVRDVAADSDFYSFQDDECSELNLKLDVEIKANEDCIMVSGNLSDTSGNDRAVTLIFALPVNAVGWRWHDDIRHSREIKEGQEYLNGVNINTGSNGMMSLYPFANISNQKHGLALALDMDMPAQYRIAYNASTKQFYIAYDFGLTQDTDKFPSSAPFKFVIYRTDSQWEFRSAAKKLYDIFSDYFVCRSKEQGIWMPFTDVSTIEGWEDFGFKYHEGINNVPFDDKAGILSFRYTEPSTWWMKIDPNVKRTRENIMNLLHEKAESGNRQAQATIVSGSFDENGRYQYLVRDTPWCNGAVFSSNPSPYIPGKSEAKMNWNEEVKRKLYGSDAEGEQDGEYLDSLEAYVTANENFRREHFHYVTVPLTFSTASRKPVIHKALSVYEFTKWLAKDIHQMDKLMFANSVPHRFAFLCPFLDIMGTEMNWLDSDGNWNPASDEWMNFKRTMCYQKPYLFLMNTNYDKFTPELVEKYFQRSLFYGMYPSMFSHNASENPYWRAPKWYNRDRHLFKRYIPIIKEVAEAGWEPITYAATDNDAVYVERFGNDSQESVYFTLLNESSEPQQCELKIMRTELNLIEVNEVKEVVLGEVLNIDNAEGEMKLELQIPSEQVRLISFRVDSQ